MQTLAVTAIDEGKVPGLAAMKPAGSVIKALNGAKGNLDRLGTYYAMTSSFKARIQSNQRHHQGAGAVHTRPSNGPPVPRAGTISSVNTESMTT